MTYPKALFFGLTLIAAAVLAVGYGRDAPAQADGAYEIGGGTEIWRLNTMTGQVSRCSVTGIGDKPSCTAWSD